MRTRITRTPWFGPKRIGRGRRPRTWQGWPVTAVFVVLLGVIALTGDGPG